MGYDSFATRITLLLWILEDLGDSMTTSNPFSSENIRVINIVCDHMKHQLTKHIGVDSSFMWSHVHDRVIAPQYVPSKLQLIDYFMKAQTRAHHNFYLHHESGEC